jgi:uncharacterized protein YcnI
MLRKSFAVIAAAVMMVASYTTVASAHATVSPRNVSAASYEKFTLRVPVEKESDTVQVRIEIPEGFMVSRVRPLAGWTYTTEKTADGAGLKAIVWTGGKIAPGEFQDFEFQGKAAEQPGKYAFKAYQTYADGETVEWAGPSDAQKPASFVEVTAGAATGNAHGGAAPATPATPAAPAAPAAPPTPAAGSNPITTAAAYGGLALGAVALVLQLRRK